MCGWDSRLAGYGSGFMNRGIKKPSLGLHWGTDIRHQCFPDCPLIYVEKMPPYWGKCLGVCLAVYCFMYKFIVLGFHPMSPSHPPFSFPSLCSGFFLVDGLPPSPSSSLQASPQCDFFTRPCGPSTSRFQTFVDISCLMATPFLFSLLLCF